ncbi:MAG: plasmid recombination protein [Tannerellaceae bacterium]|nr:plasmid recombination protein [Tannerellaceae bacterium]
MASVKKFTSSAVRNELRHNDREIKNSSNKDIDTERTPFNYSLLQPGESAYRRYKQRMGELYCYNRKDIKTMAGWVVTCPKEIKEEQQQRAFFQAVFDFLTARYGKENVVQAVVHYDEGIKEKLCDRWGEPVMDAYGKQRTKVVYGQPHLHFCFIPVAPDLNPAHPQREKVCANEVLTRKDLQTFHGDLQHTLDLHKIECAVQTGITRANGGNRTVAELKENYELKRENEKLRSEIEYLRNRDYERT